MEPIFWVQKNNHLHFKLSMMTVNTFISPEEVLDRELSGLDISISFAVVFICQVSIKINITVSVKPIRKWVFYNKNMISVQAWAEIRILTLHIIQTQRQQGIMLGKNQMSMRWYNTKKPMLTCSFWLSKRRLNSSMTLLSIDSTICDRQKSRFVTLE